MARVEEGAKKGERFAGSGTLGLPIAPVHRSGGSSIGRESYRRRRATTTCGRARADAHDMIQRAAGEEIWVKVIVSNQSDLVQSQEKRYFSLPNVKHGRDARTPRLKMFKGGTGR